MASAPPIAAQRSKVDLHLHTTYSDGDDSPADVAEACHDAGVKVAACTDHDTVEGVKEFAARAQRHGISWIAGCEITALWGETEVHCLAYFFDPEDVSFRERLSRVRQAEVQWWRSWFQRAGDAGVPVGFADVEARFGRDRIPYIGDLLEFFLKAARDDPRFASYVDTESLVRDWCRPGKPFHQPKPWRPTLAEVGAWIAEAGGVGVLAHPGRTLSGDVSRLAELRDCGIEGAEVWSTWHEPHQIAELASECDRLGLIATQGSDYHGVRLKSWVPWPGRAVVPAPDPLSIVDRLQKAAG